MRSFAAPTVVVAAWLALAAAPAAAHAELGEPRAEVGYRKGKRIRIQVVRIDDVDVEVRTARAFLAMRDAAAREGVALAIRSGFRSHADQAWLYRAWRAGWGNRAARPGRSHHQSGRALDLVVRDPDVLAWLDAHARGHGFRRTVPGEPWHWEYVGRPRVKSRAVARRR